MNGSWIRTKDKTIIRIAQENSSTVKACLPTEELSYTLKESVLEVNRDNQEYQGHFDNKQLIRWKGVNKDGNFHKSYF